MFKKLFEALRAKPAGSDSDVDLQTAVCALLVEAASADETYTDKEKALIEQAMAARFSLSTGDARAVRQRAETLQREASDVHRFTKIAKTMDHAGKAELIAVIWRIILSDGEKTPYEDAMVRQLCGLIYFDDAESGAIRQRIEAETAASS
ncbi:MAG: TerB family tellurite resistance protein [Parvularculaceae bacterium]|nr:TerB family tellurite resistance protein [Parvularculaceae bacterium]